MWRKQHSNLSGKSIRVDKFALILSGVSNILLPPREVYEGPRKQTSRGSNRLERAEKFYQTAAETARALRVPFFWELRIIPGVGHSNRKMAEALAASL